MIKVHPAASRPARDSASNIGFDVAVVKGLRGFLDLETQWRELVKQTESANPFLAWAWASSWVKHFSGDRLVTVVVRSSSRVIAIAPFHRKQYLQVPGLRATALQLFGPREAQVLFEIREILAGPGAKVRLFGAVLDALERSAGWDWIELSAQAADTEALEAAANDSSARLAIRTEWRRSTPVMRLASSWEEHKKGLKRNIKESIRHSYNSLQREGHAVSVHLAESDEEKALAIDDLLELHRLRSTVEDRYHHRDHFKQAGYRQFMHDALVSTDARLFSLRIDGEVVAVRAALDVDRMRYLYYSGFDPRWWNYGVMTLLVTEMVRDAIARGMHTVNFSPGVDPSKTRWGVDLVPLHAYVVLRRSWASNARCDAIERLRLLRSTIRENRRRAWQRLRRIG